MATIIGRKEEQEELARLYAREQSQLIAVYGRRRVGKTFLIREFFKNQFTFHHTGVSPVEFKDDRISLYEAQLKAFAISLARFGLPVKRQPKDWMEAFELLRELLIKKQSDKKQVVFIDEMPWMDTPKSGFITAFESFWNGWGSGQDNLLFIVCGSASSWIKDNFIDSAGGLYDRVDAEIPLSPFTLAESEQMLALNGIELSRYDFMEIFMTIGGVPYYLNQLKPGLSAAENVDRLFFARKSKLCDEYQKLFNSTFANSDKAEAVVRLLSSRHSGFTRTEIGQHIHWQGKPLSRLLRSLEVADFIRIYQPFGESKRNMRYRLIDPFCWFWLRHVEKQIVSEHHWRDNCVSQATRVWRGIAFEELCFQHVFQLKAALGIAAVSTTESAWNVPGTEEQRGAQMDLIISRADGMVHMLEMKCYSDYYTLDNDEQMKIRHRLTLVGEELKKRQSQQANLVTTFGLKPNKHSGIFARTVTLDDLFA